MAPMAFVVGWPSKVVTIVNRVTLTTVIKLSKSSGRHNIQA
jgi:hypothetical protein